MRDGATLQLPELEGTNQGPGILVCSANRSSVESGTRHPSDCNGFAIPQNRLFRGVWYREPSAPRFPGNDGLPLAVTSRLFPGKRWIKSGSGCLPGNGGLPLGCFPGNDGLPLAPAVSWETVDSLGSCLLGAVVGYLGGCYGKRWV